MITFNTVAKIISLSLGAAAISVTAVTAGEHSEHVTNYDDIAWKQVREGVEIAALWGSKEGGNAIWSLRLQPGVEVPRHAHSSDYHGLAIQGNWVHIDAEGNEATTGQEAMAFIKGGAFHGDRCAGPEVCIILVDYDGPRDMILPK